MDWESRATVSSEFRHRSACAQNLTVFESKDDKDRKSNLKSKETAHHIQPISRPLPQETRAQDHRAFLKPTATISPVQALEARRTGVAQCAGTSSCGGKEERARCAWALNLIGGMALAWRAPGSGL